MRELHALVAPKTPQVVRGHAGLVINKLSLGWQVFVGNTDVKNGPGVAIIIHTLFVLYYSLV